MSQKMQVGGAAISKGLWNGSLAAAQDDRYRARRLPEANGRNWPNSASGNARFTATHPEFPPAETAR